jgi:hypothetical protein
MRIAIASLTARELMCVLGDVRGCLRERSKHQRRQVLAAGIHMTSPPELLILEPPQAKLQAAPPSGTYQSRDESVISAPSRLIRNIVAKTWALATP